MTLDINKVKTYLLDLQNQITAALQQRDTTLQLTEDLWNYSEEGGGITRAFSSGQHFENAGVNFSHIVGGTLPKAATLQRPELQGSQFQALGLSLIIHPTNPFVPTVHANLRLFVAQTVEQKTIWWFGGGFDLTPYYGFVEDCVHWHQTARAACEPFGKDIYPTFKQNADDYFYLQHRQEPRGIGGLFFDDINSGGFDQSFALIKSVGDHFIPAYFPIVDRRFTLPFTEQQRDFQRYRRGRYVEFNLIYDRGTLFGLQSGGRTESILISLPASVSWQYGYQPTPGSLEDDLYKNYLTPRDWANVDPNQ
jgi:coproporphyrinogen III oxidase